MTLFGLPCLRSSYETVVVKLRLFVMIGFSSETATCLLKIQFEEKTKTSQDFPINPPLLTPVISSFTYES